MFNSTMDTLGKVSSFNSSDECINWWKSTYLQNGYRLCLKKKDTIGKNGRVLLVCKHSGKPKTHVHPDDRKKISRSTKMNCPFHVYYNERVEDKKWITGKYDLNHTCSPSTEDINLFKQYMA